MCLPVSWQRYVVALPLNQQRQFSFSSRAQRWPERLLCSRLNDSVERSVLQYISVKINRKTILAKFFFFFKFNKLLYGLT